MMPPPPPEERVCERVSGGRRGRRGRLLPGSIVVLALLAALTLSAAPAAGQTPLVNVPASAAGPVHFSSAVVTRNVSGAIAYLFLTSSQNPPAGSVPQVPGRGFRLLYIAFGAASGTTVANRWGVVGVPSISSTDRNELAVVVVHGAVTSRVLRLSETPTTFAATNPAGIAYFSAVNTWAAQAYTDVNTYTQADEWTVLVVDHTAPGVDLEALTYTPPVPPPPPAPSRVTGVRVSPLDGGLRVSWSAAAGEVSQYRVDAADASGKLVRRVYTDADVFEALVDRLANGVEYTLTVTALTSHPDVEGPASEPLTAAPQAGGGDTGGTPAPVPALPLAGAAVLAGLLAAAARRSRSARRRV